MINITKLEKAREEKGLSIKELAERVYEMDKEMYIFQEMLNIEELEQSLKDLVEAKEDLIDSQDKLIERLKENLYLKEQLLAKQKTIKYKGSIQKSFVNDKIKNNIK